MNFALILFLLTLVTAVFWVAERMKFLPARRAAAERAAAQFERENREAIDRGEKASWREVGIHMRKYMTPGEEDLREGYAFRHGENQANVAFVDGHVDARKWAEIPAGWNSDGGVFWSGDKQ